MSKYLAGMIGLMAIGGTLAMGGDLVRLRVQEPRTCFFQGGKVSLPVTLQGASDGAYLVSFALSFKDVVVLRRQVSFVVRDEQASIQTIEFDLPEIRDGIALAGRYRLELWNGHGEKLDVFESPLHVLDTNPFRNQQQWLKKLNLHVYDPEGATVAVFEMAGIPFRRITNPGAFEMAADGILIIGEGLSLRTSRGLMDAALATVSNRTSVIVLSPVGGVFGLPGLGALSEGEVNGDEPIGLQFHGADMIRRLDKRLDVVYWSRTERNVLRSFQIGAYRDKPEIQVTENPGWSLIGLDWLAGQRAYVCGFAVIRDWEASPAPRYFLAALLERIGE